MGETLPDRLLLLNGPKRGMALRLDRGVVTVASPDEVGVRRSCALVLDPAKFDGIFVFFYRDARGEGPTIEVFSMGKNDACVTVNGRSNVRQAKLRHDDLVCVGDVARVRAGGLEPLRLRLLSGERP